VLILFASLREKFEGADTPELMRGSALAMLTAGLMSLSFMGFIGLDRL
jgi:electron transport complex protein RnfA